MERKKVILIEDEVKLARFVELELRYEGYDVTVCHDGREGLQMVTDGNYDMILLDLMLPGLTGIEICRRVRKFSNVPIIMLTAKSEEEDKLKGYELGADDYITKPFNPVVMIARVKAQLRRYWRVCVWLSNMPMQAVPRKSFWKYRGWKSIRTSVWSQSTEPW